MKCLRIRIPLLIDVIFISSPDEIRRIEASGSVDRLHVYKTDRLPAWIRFFFRATKFHDADRDLWFCPMEPVSNPDYQRRRDYLWEKASLGYTRADVTHIADLLRADAPALDLAHAMVQVVNRRFFGDEIPRHITESAQHTLQDLAEAVLPWKYRRGATAQRDIMNYCAFHLPKDVHILDVGHNIGEVVQTTAGALRTLKQNLDKPIEEIFTSHPLTPKVLRIATASTTFDGLLRRPTKAGRTVLIYKIGRAATLTGDIHFTFGTGTEDRQCVFREFFLTFMRDLQTELKGAPQ